MGVIGKVLGRGGFVVIEGDAAEKLLSSEDAWAYVADVALTIRDTARELNPHADDRPFMFAHRPPDAPADGPAVAEVVYDSAIWHIIEFGSVNNPPYRPLTAAAERSGLTFVPQ
jgi:hypothetical protein